MTRNLSPIFLAGPDDRPYCSRTPTAGVVDLQTSFNIRLGGQTFFSTRNGDDVGNGKEVDDVGSARAETAARRLESTQDLRSAPWHLAARYPACELRGVLQPRTIHSVRVRNLAIDVSHTQHFCIAAADLSRRVKGFAPLVFGSLGTVGDGQRINNLERSSG